MCLRKGVEEQGIQKLQKGLEQGIQAMIATLKKSNTHRNHLN